MSAGCGNQYSRSGGPEKFSYQVQPEHNRLRLDHFLVLQHPLISRSQLKNSIKNCNITVNDIAVKASKKLKIGDTVRGFIAEEPAIKIVPQKIDFDILYEDEQLLVISKPPHLVVHPGSGNPDGTLVNGLVYYCESIAGIGDSLRPGIVHRLDKDTSGIMVIAKNDTAHRLLVNKFKERKIKKIYYALVHGLLKEANGRIVAPIGRHPVNRQKMAVRQINGKFAASSWCVEKTFEKRYSLVKIDIETGRTHQIRVHMAYLGNPVAGDSLYGTVDNNSKFPRQMLHAYEIRFTHPISEKELNITAPFWPDIANVIDGLRGDKKAS